MQYTINIIPQPASRPKVGKFGTYYSGTYKSYKDSLAWVIRRLWIDRKEYTALDVTFQIPFPTRYTDVQRQSYDHRTKPDLDNLLKAFCDALQVAGVISDDAGLCVIHARKIWSHTDGRITFELS